MFENLLFLRLTRQYLWKEQLASLNEFIKYFFALDLQNYARCSPVYLSQMYNLQSKDPETWNFFVDGNLSVNKSSVSFCSIGVDHALEQENKSMKIQGEIKVMGNNESALEENFLISCDMSQITEAFLESLRLNSDKINGQDHYQLTWGTNKEITDNKGKLKEVMKAYDVIFDKTDSVFNIISKRVLPEKAAEELLDTRNIGENMYEEFCSERLKWDEIIWDHMKKKNLPTHIVSKKITKLKLQDRVIVLKEDDSFFPCIHKKTWTEP